MSYGNLWGRTALYRLFDAEGVLLYVGISHDPEKRWTEHAKFKDWWGLVAKKATEWFEERSHAARAEEAAIRAEKPRFNILHAPESKPRVTPQPGVVVKRVSTSALIASYGTVTAPVRDARFELGELPITYIERHGMAAAVILPVWVGKWLEQHADEVIASLRADGA